MRLRRRQQRAAWLRRDFTSSWRSRGRLQCRSRYHRRDTSLRGEHHLRRAAAGTRYRVRKHFRHGDNSGKFSDKIWSNDQVGASAAKRFRLLVVRSVSISTKALPLGRTGRRYASRLAAVGGKKPYTWSLLAGTLPAGLALDLTTGRITGTPLSPAPRISPFKSMTRFAEQRRKH